LSSLGGGKYDVGGGKYDVAGVVDLEV